MKEDDKIIALAKELRHKLVNIHNYLTWFALAMILLIIAVLVLIYVGLT